MNVHVSGPGIVQTLYEPFASGCSSIDTSRLKVTAVAWSAPGVQTLPYGTSAPKIWRPRATGRLYVSVISVVATRCPTTAAWLLLTWSSGRTSTDVSVTLAGDADIGLTSRPGSRWHPSIRPTPTHATPKRRSVRTGRHLAIESTTAVSAV